MVTPASFECGLLVVLIVLVVAPGIALIGDLDHLELSVRKGSRCPFQTLPQDLVVEVGGNAVFAGEVETAGSSSPVSGVVSRLQVGTFGEQDLLRGSTCDNRVVDFRSVEATA